MLSQACREQIEKLSGGCVLYDEPMRRHTSFRVGGPAEIFSQPQSEQALCALVGFCRREDIPFYVIGAGSNLLVGDSGVRGVVVQTGRSLAEIRREGDALTVGCGAPLATVAAFAAREGLSGLEFAAGIPGLTGGAVFMNAGAYGGEMKDVVVQTEYLDENGERKTAVGAEQSFVYRGSMFSGGGKIILSARLSLVPGAEEKILAKMRELAGRRRAKQPLEYPSAGSTFKRPEGHFAAKLIEDAGLKGARVGGACVSEKHAGFVINESGQATAADVCALIEKIQNTVRERFGVELECEVRRMGDF